VIIHASGARSWFALVAIMLAATVAAVAPSPTAATAPVDPVDQQTAPALGMQWPVPVARVTPGALSEPMVPSASSVPPPRREPDRQQLVVSAVGDTNLDPAYIPVFRQEGYEYAFAGLDNLFVDDDLSIVNLECAATTIGRPVSKAFTFNCDIGALDVMATAGVEVANLANNHSADWGRDGLLETRRNVLAAGVAPVGVGADAAQAHEPALFDINGWKVAVLGFGGVVPWADWLATDTTPGMADGDTIPTMVAAVERADEVADLVFVTIHWGVELDTTPRPDDVERARAMIDAGADAVFGHHPHRLQPLEFYLGKPIAWSLGNFVWPRLSDAGATTAVARVIVEADGTIDACLIPAFIERSGQPVLQGPHRNGCRPYRAAAPNAS
jgi:poly-gamma-glutamate synthesis protein (capsule biosynthesis protein)